MNLTSAVPTSMSPSAKRTAAPSTLVPTIMQFTYTTGFDGYEEFETQFIANIKGYGNITIDPTQSLRYSLNLLCSVGYFALIDIKTYGTLVRVDQSRVGFVGKYNNDWNTFPSPFEDYFWQMGCTSNGLTTDSIIAVKGDEPFIIEVLPHSECPISLPFAHQGVGVNCSDGSVCPSFSDTCNPRSELGICHYLCSTAVGCLQKYDQCGNAGGGQGPAYMGAPIRGAVITKTPSKSPTPATNSPVVSNAIATSPTAHPGSTSTMTPSISLDAPSATSGGNLRTSCVNLILFLLHPSVMTLILSILISYIALKPQRAVTSLATLGSNNDVDLNSCDIYTGNSHDFSIQNGSLMHYDFEIFLGSDTPLLLGGHEDEYEDVATDGRSCTLKRPLLVRLDDQTSTSAYRMSTLDIDIVDCYNKTVETLGIVSIYQISKEVIKVVSQNDNWFYRVSVYSQDEFDNVNIGMIQDHFSRFLESAFFSCLRTPSTDTTNVVIAVISLISAAFSLLFVFFKEKKESSKELI
jgi:hypothetical protein